MDFVRNTSFLNIWFLVLNYFFDGFDRMVIWVGHSVWSKVHEKRWTWQGVVTRLKSWERRVAVLTHLVVFDIPPMNFPHGSPFDQLFPFIVWHQHLEIISFKLVSIPKIPQEPVKNLDLRMHLIIEVDNLLIDKWSFLLVSQDWVLLWHLGSASVIVRIEWDLVIWIVLLVLWVLILIGRFSGIKPPIKYIMRCPRWTPLNHLHRVTLTQIRIWLKLLLFQRQESLFRHLTL